MNCQPGNIITHNIISFFKTLKVGKKKTVKQFLLEEGVKKEEQGIQVIKTTTIGGEREREKERHPP